MYYIYIFLLWCISSCIRIRCTQSTTRWWWCCIPTVEIPTVHVIWEHTPALLAVVVVLYLWFGSLPHEASSHWRKRCVNARKEFLVPFFFFLFYPLQLTSSSFWHSMHCADGPLCSSALSGTFTKFSRVYLTRSSGPAAVVGRLLRVYPQAVQTNILITTCNGHGWF